MIELIITTLWTVWVIVDSNSQGWKKWILNFYKSVVLFTLIVSAFGILMSISQPAVNKYMQENMDTKVFPVVMNYSNYLPFYYELSETKETLVMVHDYQLTPEASRGFWSKITFGLFD